MFNDAFNKGHRGAMDMKSIEKRDRVSRGRAMDKIELTTGHLNNDLMHFYDTMDKLKPLKYTDYSNYFEAIARDNLPFVESLLSDSSPPAERYRLANAEFDFKDVSCPLFKTEVEKGDTAIHLPLHLAITNNALRVTELLINRGANVLGIDCMGHNLLHACVVTAFYQPELEGKLCENLRKFASFCEKETLCRLIIQENACSLRPLEFAIQQGRLDLATFFMWSMEQNMRTRTEHHGMTSYTWYDVTEYETPLRHAHSPLVLMTFLDRRHAERAVGVLECPLFGEWIKAKTKIHMIPMVIWALMRVFYVTVYFILDRNDTMLRDHYKDLKDSGKNVSEPCYSSFSSLSKGSQTFFVSFIVIYSLISLCFDIIEIVKSIATNEYKKAKDLKGWKDMIVKLYFYRICTSIVNVAVLLCSFIYQTSIQSGDAHPILSGEMQFLSVCRIVIPICACWSIMYFMQILPYLGRSIVSIQGMLIDMLSFFILWVLFMIPFIHTFNVLANTYTKQGCIFEFDGILNTLYSLFRMMLNMVELTSFDLYEAHFLYILHALYVFMVAIVLINFLIAIMSDSASRTAEHERVIASLNTLSLAVALQQRFGGWLLKPYYKFMQPRVFVGDGQGRLCIVTRTIRRMNAVWTEDDNESEM